MKNLGVSLGNGSKCTSYGVCRAMDVTVGGYTIVVDTLVLDLSGVDLILGIVAGDPWNNQHVLEKKDHKL